ncbi:MAG TPA: Tim44/TimA family putative adaptor protein [Rhizomicrobium sp.]|jgi:predicted lipid-binding transport protein (Tim44 family)
MANTQILLMVLAAMVAGLFAIRIYMLLGRRTGTEREPSEPFARMGGAAEAVAKAPILPPSDPVTRALMDIKLADPAFDADKFLSGARHAYEIVVTGFARNDRIALRPLVNDDVFAVFDGAMKTRAERGEKVIFSFGGFSTVKITHASLSQGATLNAGRAEITVAFAAQFVSATMDVAGQVIEGDPKLMRDVLDHWTFARDVHANDPNWTLVATAGPEAV